jgi:hypothetical protein
MVLKQLKHWLLIQIVFGDFLGDKKRINDTVVLPSLTMDEVFEGVRPRRRDQLLDRGSYRYIESTGTFLAEVLDQNLELCYTRNIRMIHTS